jgi:hypothetical protein
VNNEPISVDGNFENASTAPLRLAALVPADDIVTGPTWWLRVVRRSPANVGSKQVREPIEVGTVECRANSRRQVLHVGHRRLCHSGITPPVCSDATDAEIDPPMTRSTAPDASA